MSQNPNGPDYNPYGPGPSNPNYAPGYGGQPPSGPNPNYGQPPSGPNYGQPPSGPNYGQYAPPPPIPNDRPSGPYGGQSPYTAYPPNPLAPPPEAGPYDPTVFSASGANYPPYPQTGAPNYNTPISNPGYNTPISNPNYNTPISSPNLGLPGTLPPQPQPPRKFNSRVVLISVIGLLIVVAGVLGVVLYNNHLTTVRNNDATATAHTQANATSTAQTIASATANAMATATYVQTHYPFSSDLVLDDSLKDNSQASKWGWDVGSSCAFSNGAYEVTEKEASSILACFAKHTNFTNFTFEVQMDIKSGGTYAAGGLMFRANSSTYALYILFLDTQGNWELDIRGNSSGGSTRRLSQGQISNFTTGYFNLHNLAVSANGSEIKVFIDQNQVASVNDSTFSGGSLGVISDYDTAITTVAYSNAKVWKR